MGSARTGPGPEPPLTMRRRPRPRPTGHDMIALDNNATTRPTAAVADAMVRALRELWGNPSSVHRGGQAARAALELARQQLAALMGCSAKRVTITSSGTEAIDLAIRGWVEASAQGGARGQGGGPPVVLAAGVEHAAVTDLLGHLHRGGSIRWEHLPVDESGRIDAGAAGRLLDGRAPEVPAMVVAQWANNETGVIQPVHRLAELARAAGAVSLIDGTQWVGKMPTRLVAHGAAAGGAAAGGAAPAALACDLFAASAHKFHGPKGVGVLVTAPGVNVVPRLHGAQELGRRAGTENVPGVVGAGQAAAEAGAWLDAPGWPAESARLAGLRDRLESLVLAGVPAVVHARGADRLWNTTNIAFPGAHAEALLLALSERGVQASAGAACSSGSLEPSAVLRAMGVPEALAHASLRFSLSRFTTEAEVEEAAGEIVRCARAALGPHAGTSIRSTTP